MIVKIINIVLENTFTTDDLAARLGLMRIYYGARLFRTDETNQRSLREVLASEECEEYTLLALEAWDARFAKANIPEQQVYDALDGIEQELTTLPSIVLYVPIRFTQDYLVGFGMWFRANVAPNLLMTVRIDTRVSGGCAVVWNSTYRDFSLRYFIRRQRSELIAMCNRHTRSHV